MHFTAGNTPDAPRSDLPELLSALAADLRSAGYTVDGVAGLLGESANAALGRDQLIPALIVTEQSCHTIHGVAGAAQVRGEGGQQLREVAARGVGSVAGREVHSCFSHRASLWFRRPPPGWAQAGWSGRDGRPH